METIETRVYNLVKEEFEKLNLSRMSKRYSKRAVLDGICSDIIYNQWGIGNDRIWKLVTENVEKFITEEMD